MLGIITPKYPLDRFLPDAHLIKVGRTFRQQLMSPRFMKHLLIIISVASLVGTVKAAPIHDAAKNGDLAYVKLELENGVEVNLKNLKSMQETPLHFAAEVGQKRSS